MNTKNSLTYDIVNTVLGTEDKDDRGDDNLQPTPPISAEEGFKALEVRI